MNDKNKKYTKRLLGLQCVHRHHKFCNDDKSHSKIMVVIFDSSCLILTLLVAPLLTDTVMAVFEVAIGTEESAFGFSE